MKKLLLVLFTLSVIAFAAPFSAAAQVVTGVTPEKAVPAFWRNVVLELDASIGTKHDGMAPLELGANLGYRFIPRMYAFVHGGNLMGLYDKDHGRRYTKSAVLGGGLGYTLWRTEAMDVDLRGMVTAAVGDADYKHVAYDAGLRFRVNTGGALKVNIGVGFRHVSSRTSGIGTYNGLFGTLGFGF